MSGNYQSALAGRPKGANVLLCQGCAKSSQIDTATEPVPFADTGANGEPVYRAHDCRTLAGRGVCDMCAQGDYEKCRVRSRRL
jgi:hypothetical protein